MKLTLRILTLLLLLQTLCYAQGNDTIVSIKPVNTTVICPGDTLHVYYQVNRKFLSGNIFSAQLSDATGSFSSNTIILGSYPSDTDGRIICTVPNIATAGTSYRIRITASNPVRTSLDNGTDIIIKPLPAVGPTNNSPMCERGIVTLNAHNTSTGAVLVWDGPASFSASGSPTTLPSVQPNMAGWYHLTATLNGCVVKDSTKVIVNPKPVANITTNSPVCVGDTMKLNMNWQPYTTNSLHFPSGAIANNNSQYIIHNAVPAYGGTYMLVVTDTNNCKDSTYKNFTIKPAPDTPDIISNSPLCTGKKLQMFGLPGSSTNASFEWKGPGGYTSSSPTPYINNTTVANAGVYTLRTYYNGCYSAAVTDTIVIVDKPDNPEGFSNGPLCDGDGLQLDAKEIKGAYYMWTGPHNFKSNFRNPFVQPVNPLFTGYYVIQDSISGGCVNTDTIYVEVNPFPEKAQIFNNAPVCEGDSLKLHVDRKLAGTHYTWWGPNGANDTGVAFAVRNMTTNNAGWYGVIANYKNCVTIGDTIDIKTKPLPAVPVINTNAPLWEGQELQLSATSTTAGTGFSWNGPNGYTDTGSTVYIGNITTAQRGTYIVTADKDGCLSSSTTVVEVKTFTDKNSVLLYPSPNDGNFTLELKVSIDQTIPVNVLNQAGQLMYATRLQTTKKFLHYNFALKGQLAGGRYYLQLMVDGNQIRLPFVVDRQ